MNIFILDTDIKTSARYNVDKHCVKMILEHCQMLCTVVSINSELQNKLSINTIPYKPTHAKHPCTVWVNSHYDNFAWLVAYTHELHNEYNYRYNRNHLSYTTLRKHNIITDEIIAHGSSLAILDLNPIAAMPDECKTNSVIESYRNYYRLHKSHMFNWTKRDKPEWV